MKKLVNWIWFTLAVVVLAAIDQWTKWLAVVNLKEKNAFPLIPDIFEFLYHENRGAAFSSFQGKGLLLVCGTIIVLLLVLYSYAKVPAGKKYIPLRIIFAMLTAGAIGNMIDRITRHYVVDFLYFKLIDFPVFNVADCYVTISVILFGIFGFFVYHDQDIDFLFQLKPKKKN